MWTVWTISGRIGEVKTYTIPISSVPPNVQFFPISDHREVRPCRTFGRGWVEPLAEPSADRIVTVGREAISRDWWLCRGCRVVELSFEFVVANFPIFLESQSACCANLKRVACATRDEDSKFSNGSNYSFYKILVPFHRDKVIQIITYSRCGIWNTHRSESLFSSNTPDAIVERHGGLGRALVLPERCHISFDFNPVAMIVIVAWNMGVTISLIFFVFFKSTHTLWSGWYCSLSSVDWAVRLYSMTSF